MEDISDIGPESIPEMVTPDNPADQLSLQEPFSESVALSQQLQQIISRLDLLTTSSDEILSKTSIDSSKDDMIKLMHSELQDYKNDMYSKIVSPVLKSVISLADKVRSIAQYYNEPEQNEDLQQRYAKLLREYNNVALMADDLLFDYDFESYSSQPGDEFNAKIHTALKTEVTDNADLDRRICRSLKSGYRNAQDRIIRKEEVIVYKLKIN